MIEYLIPFHIVAPELAKKEVRVLTLPEPMMGLPKGGYALMEAYCPDPACDCRRVLFTVIGEHFPGQVLATISYCFDRDVDRAGPLLDPLNYQSELAYTLLGMVTELVLSDRAYLERLERHYAMAKQAAADPTHPAYAEMRAAMGDKEG
jgi:hypothetical protein